MSKVIKCIGPVVLRVILGLALMLTMYSAVPTVFAAANCANGEAPCSDCGNCTCTCGCPCCSATLNSNDNCPNDCDDDLCVCGKCTDHCTTGVCGCCGKCLAATDPDKKCDCVFCQKTTCGGCIVVSHGIKCTCDDGPCNGNCNVTCTQHGIKHSSTHFSTPTCTERCTGCESDTGEALGHDHVDTPCVCSRSGCEAGSGHNFDEYGTCRNSNCDEGGGDPGCTNPNGHFFDGNERCEHCGFAGIAADCPSPPSPTGGHQYYSNNCIHCGMQMGDQYECPDNFSTQTHDFSDGECIYCHFVEPE